MRKKYESPKYEIKIFSIADVLGESNAVETQNAFSTDKEYNDFW